MVSQKGNTPATFSVQAWVVAIPVILHHKINTHTLKRDVAFSRRHIYKVEGHTDPENNSKILPHGSSSPPPPISKYRGGEWGALMWLFCFVFVVFLLFFITKSQPYSYRLVSAPLSNRSFMHWKLLLFFSSSEQCSGVRQFFSVRMLTSIPS